MLTVIKISFSDERAALFPAAQSQHQWWSCRLIWLRRTPGAGGGIIRLPVMKWLRCYCQLPVCYEVQVCAWSTASVRACVCALVNMCVNFINVLHLLLRNTQLPSMTTLLSRCPRLRRSKSPSPCDYLGLIAFTCWSKSHLGNSAHILNESSSLRYGFGLMAPLVSSIWGFENT